MRVCMCESVCGGWGQAGVRGEIEETGWLLASCGVIHEFGRCDYLCTSRIKASAAASAAPPLTNAQGPVTFLLSYVSRHSQKMRL